ICLALLCAACGDASQLVEIAPPGAPDAIDSSDAVTTCSGVHLVAASNAKVGGWDLNYRDLTIDVNGDGKTDLVRVWNNGSAAAGTDACAQVSLSNGSGFAYASNASVGGWDLNFVDLGLDVNGDGKAD